MYIINNNIQMKFDPTKFLISSTYLASNKWAYNRQFENQIFSLLKTMKFIDDFVLSPEGFFPGYDAIVYVNNVEYKVELKAITGSKIKIETSRYDGTPSGLSVTTSDFYLTLSGEYLTGKWIGKLRLFKTKFLRSLDTQDNIRFEYVPDTTGPGSRGFLFNPWHFKENHKWVGDFLTNDDGSLNISKFSRHNWYFKF